MEGAVGPGRSSAANVEAISRALETAGIILLSEDEVGGPGVRFKKKLDN